MTLPETFDISVVRQHHQALLDLLEHQSPVTIDASLVQRADAAAMQLLTAAMVEARRTARSIELRHPSPAFQQVARTLGLDGVLGLALS